MQAEGEDNIITPISNLNYIIHVDLFSISNWICIVDKGADLLVDGSAAIAKNTTFPTL